MDECSQAFHMLERNAKELGDCIQLLEAGGDEDIILRRAKQSRCKYVASAMKIYVNSSVKSHLLKDWKEIIKIIDAFTMYDEDLQTYRYLAVTYSRHDDAEETYKLMAVAYLHIQNKLMLEEKTYEQQVTALCKEQRLFVPFNIAKLGVLRALLDNNVSYRGILKVLIRTFDLLEHR